MSVGSAASTFHLEVTVKRYPLVFSFRDIIAGNGYVAAVGMDGRVLLTEEDDGDTWMFGVQPGGIAGGDRGRDVAFAEFRKSYSSVLFDFAADATSFGEFEAKVTEFFNQINEPVADEWDLALVDVRTKQLSLADLRTVKSESRTPRLTIEEIAPETANANANEFDQIAKAA